MFTPPKVASLPGSKGDKDRPPSWYRPGVLGEVVERCNLLFFVYSKRHPAFAGLDEVYLGRDGEVGTAQAVERAFREALATKKAWKAKRKAERAERAVELFGLKQAA
jgi:hypothetical protein